jgi:hypothetical protein
MAVESFSFVEGLSLSRKHKEHDHVSDDFEIKTRVLMKVTEHTCSICIQHTHHLHCGCHCLRYCGRRTATGDDCLFRSLSNNIHCKRSQLVMK